MGRVTVAIALGSSLGDRAGHLAFAVDRLRPLLDECRVSPVIETAPVDVPTAGEPAPFLNAAAVGSTTLSPHDLLTALHAIEDERGRQRPYPNAPRTLDLDLILYGDQQIADAGLVVPHPRFRDRLFVLDPLSAVAPSLVDPVTGLTIAALRDRLHARTQAS